MSLTDHTDQVVMSWDKGGGNIWFAKSRFW